MKRTFTLLVFSFLLSTGIQHAVAQNGSLPNGNHFSCPINASDFEESVEKMMNCTGYSTTDYFNKYSRQITYIPDSHTPIKVIKIAFHFFQDANGGNMWPDNQATRTLFDSVVSNLNKHKSNISPPSWPINGVSYISDARIRYELTGIYFYQNDSLNSIDSTHTKFDAAIAAVDPDRLNSLGIYYTGSTYYDNNSFASGLAEPYAATNSVIIYNNGFYGNPGLGTLDHELGHCLGLNHTYNSEILIKSDSEYLSDVFDVSWGNYCSPPPNKSCYHQTGWNWDPNDHVAHPYATNNIMGGCLDTYYMSPLQLGRSHRTLALNGLRKYVKEMISEATYPWTINSNETWDFDIQMYQDIVVKKNSTLTIKCKVGMANNGRIIVERGARLIIDGGEVFAWGTSWEGVQVWGTSTERQTINSTGTLIGLSPHHGIVKVINGGTLRGARNAIVTTKTAPNGDIDWNGYFGGIIQCDGASFINNHVSVAFMTHRNYLGTLVVPNLSFIRRSSFEVNNDMALKEPNDPYLNAFVSLWNVEGVRLEGNTYKNNCNPLPAISNRGTGIVSYDGGYTLSRYRLCSAWGTNGCAGYSVDEESRFVNLNYGVYATESSPLASISVYENDFENCNRSIYMLGTRNTKISYNRIQMADGDASMYPYGIYSDWCTAYDISNNKIGMVPGSYHGYWGFGTGICINNTIGLTNMIYRNEMNNLRVGTTVLGDNRGFAPGQGLRLQCNEYGQNTLNFIDIWLSNETLDPGRIDAVQGTASKGANNRFSHNPTQGDYYDQGFYPVQYYYNPETTQSTEPLYYTLSLAKSVNATQLDWVNMCPENRGNLGAGGGLHNKLAAIANLNTTQISLKAQIDNNSTSWFLDAINGTITVPAIDLKAALVNASPYLSDEVLIAVFTSPLATNENIVALHKKNAPVTKIVWEVLEGLSLPELIRTKLENEQNKTTLSARAVLEASIADIDHQKEFEIDAGIKELLNDSLGYAPDSLALLIAGGNSEGLRNRLASFYVSTDQLVYATELFQTIRETTGGLNSFCRLQEIIVTLKQSDHNVFTLKTNIDLKQEVENIAANRSDPAYVNALSLLSLVFGTNSEESVVLPEVSGAKGFWQGQNETQMTQKETIRTLILFPNPSNGDITVSNSLEGAFSSAELVVYDISGHQLMSQALKEEESNTKLMTGDLKAGIYFVHLIVDGQDVETQKFVKQ